MIVSWEDTTISEEIADPLARITSFEITFLHADGTTTSSFKEFCDGNNEVIFLAKSCTIPMTVLTEQTGLEKGDEIQAQIR